MEIETLSTPRSQDISRVVPAIRILAIIIGLPLGTYAVLNGHHLVQDFFSTDKFINTLQRGCVIIGPLLR